MKIKVLFYCLLFLSLANAQKAQFNINDYSYIIEKIDNNQIISASWILGHLQISFVMPSKEKVGAFDTVGIETYGRELKTYPVGADTQKIIDKTGTDEGCGSISAHWFSGRDRKDIATNMGLMENATGYVKITKVIDNNVSGLFQANVAGTLVSGNFENIKVKSW